MQVTNPGRLVGFTGSVKADTGCKGRLLVDKPACMLAIKTRISESLQQSVVVRESVVQSTQKQSIAQVAQILINGDPAWLQMNLLLNR